jgi:hypothetical protein
MNAVAYAEKGWWVLPLKPQSKEPCKFLRHGYLDASSDKLTVKKWFANNGLNSEKIFHIKKYFMKGEEKILIN